MNDEPTKRRFQSGRQVLQAYIPGYSPPQRMVEEVPFEVTHFESAEEATDSLLASLRTKLDALQLKRCK